MTDNIDKIKDRIRKLLRMANDSSSPNEAAIAAERATKLLRKHQLDHADVIMDELENDDVLIRNTAGRGYKRMPGYLQSLAVAIARITDTQARIVHGQARSDRHRFIEFAGYRPDVQLAEWLLEYLSVQIDQLATAHRSQITAGLPPHEYSRSPRRYMTSYREGLSDGIRAKLADTYAEGDQQATDTARALVVAKERAIERAFGQVKYGTRSPTTSKSAYSRGGKDAGRVNVTRGVTGRRASGPTLLGNG